MKNNNILLITTDQQRYDTICAMGYDFMVTPNLDQLAAEGCCYPNAYSNNPVCMAARHNIITGLTARYHGFDDNYFEDDPKTIPYDLPTLPQLLSDGGYDTIAIGKMHFQPCRRHNGFTKMELMEEIPRYLEDDEYTIYLKENGYGDLQSPHGVRHLLYMLPQRSLIDEEHHGSSWVAQRSICHLKENAGKRPFYMWSSFIAPHPPFDVPEGWADLYKGKELPPLKASRTPISEIAEWKKYIADYPNEAYLQRARELYYASISFVDYNIGKILQQLKDMGEYDNTLIIFTSDHGEMLGDHGTYQKMLPYEGSARIPFIMRFPPRLKAGSEDTRFVDINDILPTVLDVAGVPYPKPDILPGESVFKEKGFKDRTVQYVEHSHGKQRWVSLRDKRYKYNFYYGGGREELFDMENDPDETTNLLYENQDTGILAVKEQLKVRLIALEKQYGLEGYVKNDQFVVQEEFKRFAYRENNPPQFPEKQNGTHISLEEEVRRAVAHEPVVKLEELDIPYFAERGTLDREKLLKKRKNLLFIMADQFAYNAMGYMTPGILSPCLDQLAKESIQFSHCYTNSPLCMPARAALATGLYPQTLGIDDNACAGLTPESETWMQKIRAAGYETSLFGKAHLHKFAPDLRDLEWQTKGYGYEIVNELPGPRTYGLKKSSYYDYLRERDLLDCYCRDMDRRYKEGHVYDSSPTPLKTKDYADVFIADCAVRYLEQCSDERPWFCTVGFGGPHDPWDTPKEYVELYKDMTPPPPLKAPYSVNPNRPKGVYDEILNGSYDPGLTEDIRNMTEADVVSLRRSYYGHVTLIDHQIKRLTDCLKTRGMLDNTIIVFTADHGEQNGDYGLLFKQTFFETSARVPVMIAIPSEKGKTIDTPVELMDLGATLCELLGIDGRTGHASSWIPVLNGMEHAKEPVVSQLFGETMLLENSYKAVFNRSDEIYLLFNLKEDPEESKNLAAAPEAAGIEEQFRCSLENFRRRIGSHCQENEG